MMHMGFLFPGMGMFLWILLGSIAAVALLFAVRSPRSRTRLNRKGPGPGQMHTRGEGLGSIHRTIMRLAQERGGVLTVSDVVLATELSTKQAEEILNDMADGFRIKMEVTGSGIVRYEFTELIATRQQSENPLP